MFSSMNETEWKHSPLSIAVPGQLAGLYTVHKEYGKLPWESVVKPAENLARSDFKVSASLFKKMASAESVIMADDELRGVFAPNGELLNKGQTIRLKKLADTLAAIGKYGMNVFYNGSIARRLVEDIQKINGIITIEDMRNYRVIIREPLVAHAMEYKIITAPPPATGGAVMILILKTLSRYNLKGVAFPLLMHRTIEALKYALAMRTNLGDPAFVNITSVLRNMISNSTADKLKSLINDKKTYDPPHYGSKWSQLNDHGTSHICIIDGKRNVVTMTTSINTKWGSKFMSPSTGIFLNNQMYDFSTPKSKVRPGAPANYARPFKRPLSSMAPTILEMGGGHVKAVIGSAGGMLIPDAVTQVLLNYLILKKRPFESVMAPRLYHRLYPNVLLYENYTSSSGDRYTFSDTAIKELKSKGHRLKMATGGMTTCQFVVKMTEGKDAGTLVAVSDPRKCGFPAVYLTLVSSFAIQLLLLFLASCPESAHAGRKAMIVAKHGVVATDETECSRIGRDVLKRGGHAVDAAVAASLCLGVVCPAYSGIGGGGFMLVRSSKGEAKVFDMREMAPGRASKDMYAADVSKWRSGPLSVAVPGALAGLYTAHKEYGKLPWESLVKPAEKLARKGFTISPSLFKSIVSAEKYIMADKELRSIFAPKGKLLSRGKTLYLRKLADTLAAISQHGINIFYNGSIANSLVNDIQRASGIITKEDLAKYRVITRKPLNAKVLGYQVVTAPPPASGGAMMILILKILSNYKPSEFSSALGMHRAVEALKYALALRTNLGDPGFVDVANVLKNMLSTSYAAELVKRINDSRTYDPAHYGTKWGQTYDHGTTHLCVVDNERNAVSMTLSINSYFGSKFMSASTGIFLNNQMFDFAIPGLSTPIPSPANYILPYKRPLSSMTPSIFVKDGKVRVVVGAAGGLLIPDAVTQVLINKLIWKADPLSSVIAPRYYHVLYPNVLYYENYTDAKGEPHVYSSWILKEMRKRGHILQISKYPSICQLVVQYLNSSLVAVSDPRKGGFPAGY